MAGISTKLNCAVNS